VERKFLTTDRPTANLSGGGQMVAYVPTSVRRPAATVEDVVEVNPNRG
jgi:hypothetical protein